MNDPLMLQKEIQKNLAKRNHLEFIEYCWTGTEKYAVGRHTRTICHMIDNAIKDYEEGKSTFLVVKVHPRAGKSEILSQNLTAHFIGKFPDKEVMICCYNSTLAEKNSRLARRIIEGERYKELYSKRKIEGGVQQWNIEGYKAMVTASGLLSGVIGNGYTLGMVDDYIAGRENAESKVIRDKIWEEFATSFLTRRAPVSITIVLATQWHIDDVIGRIERKMDKESEEYDADFPKFKIVSFPATDGEGDVWVEEKEDSPAHWEHQKWDYLFPERFSHEFYKQQRAVLGKYSFAALYQCSPQIRGGNQIDTKNIKMHNNEAEFPVVRYYRVWDLAHTKKQTQKDDPDWTSGTLLAYVKKGLVWELWIKRVDRIRAAAPERDNFIRAVTEKDGAGVAVCIEYSAESIDAYNQMCDILRGRRRVMSVKCKGDKVARMSYVEPIFEAGNVHILAGSWNLDWLNEVNEFPSGKHDDQIDNISAGYALLCNGQQQMATGDLSGI